MPARKRLLAAIIVSIGLAVLAAPAVLLSEGHRAAAAALAIVTVLLAAAAGDAFLVSFDLFGSSLRRGTGPSSIALTFDDGPGPDTPAVLDALARAGARATFFVLGAKAEERPELVREIARRGHTVALHGFSHRKLALVSPRTIGEEIDRGRRAVEGCGVQPAPFFRAPHGHKGLLLARALSRRGLRLVGWTRGVWDTERPGAGRIVERATRRLEAGEIVLLHDGCGTPGIDPRRDQTAEAVAEIVRLVRESGLEPVTVPELAASTAEPSRAARLWHAVPMLLLLAGAIWAVHDIDWAVLRRAVGSARPGLVVLAALVNFGALFLQAARWDALLKPLAPAVRLRSAFEAMLTGFAAATVIPARAAEVLRIEWLARRAGLSRAAIAGTVALDHLVNGVGLAAGLLVLPHLTFEPNWMRVGTGLMLAAFVAGAVGALVLRPDAAARGAALSRRAPGLVAALARAREGLAAVHDRHALGLSLAFSLAAWMLELTVVVLSLRAVGLVLPLSAALLALLAVNLALGLPVSAPGNFGTLEVGAVLALVGLGVTKEHALAFALCYHLLQVVPIGIAGLAVAGVDQLRRSSSRSPFTSSGQTAVASAYTSANRPPSAGGTNLPQEIPSE
jgi:peptidoglycan/xylan/chitin deacetylase (PgdA/CDA1 family)